MQFVIVCVSVKTKWSMNLCYINFFFIQCNKNLETLQFYKWDNKKKNFYLSISPNVLLYKIIYFPEAELLIYKKYYRYFHFLFYLFKNIFFVILSNIFHFFPKNKTFKSPYIYKKIHLSFNVNHHLNFSKILLNKMFFILKNQ